MTIEKILRGKYLMSSKKPIKKTGWNWGAFWKSFYWYGKKGMATQATFMVVAVIITVGLALLPVMFYCGKRGNADFYKHIKSNAVII